MGQGLQLALDTGSDVPLFRQLADQFRLQIAQGELSPGDALPSVRRVAGAVRINLNTVAKAYRLLADEGLVELRHGKGARVVATATGDGAIPAEAQRELEMWIARMKTQGVSLGKLEVAFRLALAASKGEPA